MNLIKSQKRSSVRRLWRLTSNWVCLLLLILIHPFNVLAKPSLMQVKTVLHIDSTISDGSASLFDIARAAEKEGFMAVIFTERDNQSWEYGLWPLRNTLKKRVEINSIATYGADNYLSDIERIRQEFPNMVFIAGIEAAPNYYWRGSLLRNNLTMCDWHKHMIAVGLDSASDYRQLPVISNSCGIGKRINFFMLFVLMAVVFFMIRFLMAKSWRLAVIFLVCGFFLFDNLYSKPQFDQYHNAGIRPYQSFIDYINQKGGLVYWAHPEAEYIDSRGKISFETLDHTDNLLKTKSYTGFLVFEEGYKKVGIPGGIWDKLLNEYCRGKRDKPIWAVAGVAFDSGNDLDERLKNIFTMVLVEKLSRKDIMEALKNGRDYAVRGSASRDFILTDFNISGGENTESVGAGEEIQIKDKPIIHIGAKIGDKELKVNIKIIRDGVVVKAYDTETPFDLSYEPQEEVSAKSYYRLEIDGNGLQVVTNPIFIKKVMQNEK